MQGGLVDVVLQPSKEGCVKEGIKGGEEWKCHSWFLTGLKDIAIEMKKCIRADLCKETITYMGFPIANGSKNCRSAIRNGAWVRPPTPIFFVLSLEKLLH